MLAAPAAPNFVPFESFHIGSYPLAVAIADVSGDGRRDVVLTTGSYYSPRNDNHLFVFRQRRNGRLASPVRLRTDGAPNDHMGVAAGDLDGDGKTDVAVATGKGVDLYYQRRGLLVGPHLVRGTRAAGLVQIADLNADGHADLVIGRGPPYGYSGIQVALRRRGGGFRVTRISRRNPEALAVADVSGDGRLDIVAVEESSIDLFVKTPRGWRASRTRVGDINLGGVATGRLGDATRAIVVSEATNSPNSRLDVLRLTAGTLRVVASHRTGDNPTRLALVDVDGDGRLDLVVTHEGYPELSLYRQTSPGKFGPEDQFPAPVSSFVSSGLAVGDVTGDRKPDVVLAVNSGYLAVLKQIRRR